MFVRDRAYLLVFRTEPIRGMKDYDGNWNYNITECKQQFFSQFPDYIITEYFRRNVINLVDKFRATECTERKKSVIWPTKVTQDVVEDARERMQRGPNKSVKKLAVEIGVSYGSAHKILRNKLEINIPNHKEYVRNIVSAEQSEIVEFEGKSQALSTRNKDDVMKIWTLTLREEHRLRVFENKVLRKIFGAKRDEVTGEWRKLHNTELHALYSSPDIIRNIKSRRLRWAGHIASMGESRNAYRVLVGRPDGKRPLGRSRRRRENNINMDLREIRHIGGMTLYCTSIYYERITTDLISLERTTFDRVQASDLTPMQHSERRIAMAKEALNTKRNIFCEPLEKELRKRLMKCFVWSLALYRSRNMDIMTK
ncbi:hypothetical protein ANN_00430 [Periplaneta americana]|uniref:Uncharacterized protein n=1 Tax=Periplaneta americana TaxID=6978 RepID=A0ABQ8TQR8_PERAM|nr:hypothetical protein ANN_00430 [Periplaneta americana]